MELAVTFAQALKQHRKAHDLTQAELARQVSCATVTIQRVEQGSMRPSRQIAERLAAIFDLLPPERERFIRLARTGASPPEHPGELAGAPSSSALLPVPLTPLIGRTREVAVACQALESSGARLLTLTGPGGIGKTRLALQVATDVESVFTDGVVFVDLAPIGDPDLVPTTIARALDLPEVDGQLVLARLRAAVRDRQLLLLLDNFEQVVAAAPVIADLLQAAPRLKVLLTSRVVVGVYGEHVMELPPLSYPDLELLPPGADHVQQLGAYEAIRLFEERARAMESSFVVGADNAATVAGICRRLEGVPLAIELAAARVRVLPPRALLTRLEHRLTLLAGGPRTLPDRQRTLRATIDWSYNLLDEHEQVLFRRLSVFVGGWSLEAAEAVCAGEGIALDVVDGLQLLRDKHLLRQAERVEGEPRFTMLETIREYALERLAASGEAEAVWQRHAAYFLALVEQGEAGGTSGDQVEQEHANLLAAVTWSQTAGDPGMMVRLVASLAWFWRCRGYWWQQREWLRALLARASAAEPPPIRAARLALAAELADNAEQARPLVEESLALYREAGDARGTIAALTHLANIAHEMGDLPVSRQLQGAALGVAREAGDTQQLAHVLHNLADLEREEGNVAGATARYTESLALYQQQNSQGDVAGIRTSMGDLALCQGEPVRARALYHEALGTFQAGGNRLMQAMLARNLGRVAHALGDDTQARVELEDSLHQFRAVGLAYGIGCCLEALAGVVGSQGQAERAARLFGAGQALRQGEYSNALRPAWPIGARVDYERDLAAVRAQLDDRTFEVAWVEGRGMTLEYAIAYALKAAASC